MNMNDKSVQFFIFKINIQLIHINILFFLVF